MIALNYWVSIGIIPALDAWYSQAQVRVSHAKDALVNVRSIKMAGLTTTVIKKLETYLGMEIQSSIEYRWRMVLFFLTRRSLIFQTAKLGAIANQYAF